MDVETIIEIIFHFYCFRLAKLALVETYENSAHFDITFTMFVWVAFMPVVTTPGFYASWQMSRFVWLSFCVSLLKKKMKVSGANFPPLTHIGHKPTPHV